MRKATLAAALVVVVLGFAASVDARGKPADWFAGLFEGPFVDTTPTAQVGSEGKVGADGSWKVEIDGVGAGNVAVCLESGASSTVLLARIAHAALGELKAECVASLGVCLESATPPAATGAIRQVPDGTYATPRLVIRAESTNTCTGAVKYQTGFSNN